MNTSGIVPTGFQPPGEIRLVKINRFLFLLEISF